MTGHHLLIMASGLLAVSVYGWRINEMTWRTHRPRCVLAQLSGAVLSCGLIYCAAGGLPVDWLYPGLCIVMGHLAATGKRWQDGPPPETESRPMPFDGAPQR